MGEYWKAVNVTRHEYIHPHDLDHGLKLAEWDWEGSAVRAMMDAKWPEGDGDLVVAVGDYGNWRMLREGLNSTDIIPTYEHLDSLGYKRISRSP